MSGDKKEKAKKGEKNENTNVNSDVVLKFPELNTITCKNCMFRAEDIGKVKGATLARCDCYPKNDKPIDILFNGYECEYYVDENIK